MKHTLVIQGKNCGTSYLIVTLKNSHIIKVPLKKGAAKIKDMKVRDLYKILYLNFPSARSLHMSRPALISVKRMPLFLII